MPPDPSSSEGEPRLLVYIDIDGTILFEPGDGTDSEDLDFQLVCEGLAEFLEFVIQHCQPYWLSYRTRLGALKHLEQRLYHHLPDIARAIPAAHWKTFKHEAISPETPFVWFDDDIEPEDTAWLTKQGQLAAHVRVDATNRHNPLLMLNEVKSRLERLAT